MVVEKFQHKPSKIKIKCTKCGNEEFRKIIGKVRHKITYDAKGTYENRIKPDINRINKNIADGKDKDFLDITGD
jgi:hypothetical protein